MFSAAECDDDDDGVFFVGNQVKLFCYFSFVWFFFILFRPIDHKKIDMATIVAFE